MLVGKFSFLLGPKFYISYFHRLEENLKSNQIVLSEDIKERIRNLIDAIQVEGGRYDDASLQRCNI